MALLLSLGTSPLFAGEFQYGVRGFFGGGYASGKGLWDWTDTQETGTLQWGMGGGGGLASRMSLSPGLYLEAGLNFVYINARQSLDSRQYSYTQMSMEIPLQIKARLPFEKSDWYLGAGPDLILLPFEAERNGEAIPPDKPFMLALQAGLDYRLLKGEGSDLLLSVNFIHPVTSPAYAWEEESSGSIRINRLELCMTWLLHGRGGNK